MHKTAFLLFLATLVSFLAEAQDKIYKKNGDIIEAKVKMVNATSIDYKRSNNPDGPDYSILKKEVSKIVYQNGTTDNFAAAGGDSRSGKTQGRSSKQKYGDNMLCIMPTYTAQPGGDVEFAGFSDPGIGITYERLLDRNGHISFYIPVVLSFSSQHDFNNYVYPTVSGNNRTYTSVMFIPGVKFYPAPSSCRFRYSLGASFFALTGSEPYNVYDTHTGSGGSAYGDWRYTVYGIMISNSLNVTVNKHLFIGFDLAGGVPFSDNRRKDLTFIDNPVPIVQFGVKVGARF